MSTKPRPVIFFMSVLATAQVFFGGMTTITLMSDDANKVWALVGAIGMLAVASLQAGVQFYVQNLVTPHVDVAAYRDEGGTLIAGPAAPQADGTPVLVRNRR